MAFILLEGADRSGKSTVAALYKKQGYKVVHMNVPDKKYFDPDYSGESYFEEVIRMYSGLEGQDVLFDRTVWGELIWPSIFGRQSLLSIEDLEYLAEIENNNSAVRMLMHDPNVDAHWQRCVDNKEPLNRQQFGRALVLYEKLVNDYGFEKKQLGDFVELPKKEKQTVLSERSNSETTTSSSETKDNNQNAISPSSIDIEQKLEKANAIRALLSGPIVKKKDKVYQNIDLSIRSFLKEQLDEIFDGKKDKTFDESEVQILKLYAQRILERNQEKQ